MGPVCNCSWAQNVSWGEELRVRLCDGFTTLWTFAQTLHTLNGWSL